MTIPGQSAFTVGQGTRTSLLLGCSSYEWCSSCLHVTTALDFVQVVEALEAFSKTPSFSLADSSHNVAALPTSDGGLWLWGAWTLLAPFHPLRAHYLICVHY